MSNTFKPGQTVFWTRGIAEMHRDGELTESGLYITLLKTESRNEHVVGIPNGSTMYVSVDNNLIRGTRYEALNDAHALIREEIVRLSELSEIAQREIKYETPVFKCHLHLAKFPGFRDKASNHELTCRSLDKLVYEAWWTLRRPGDSFSITTDDLVITGRNVEKKKGTFHVDFFSTVYVRDAKTGEKWSDAAVGEWLKKNTARLYGDPSVVKWKIL